MNNLEYVVIQAGGKGTRLGSLTDNKPKALVSYKSKPYIFYTLEKFSKSKIIVIGDYKYDVLEKYLNAFASQYDIIMVEADGKGTIGGLNQALKYIPENKEFVLIWCDLIVGTNESFNFSGNNIVKLSNKFSCRWQYEKGQLIEKASNDNGVAGMFLFKSKEELSGLPESGEFVRWLSDSNVVLEPEYLIDTIEVGTKEMYHNIGQNICRPFNSIEIKESLFIKKPTNEYGERIAQMEIDWYSEISKYNFDFIPEIYSKKPLTMKYIPHEPLEKLDLSIELQRDLLKRISDNIKKIHNVKVVKAITADVYETYYYKTFNRLDTVKDLIPFANRKTIIINEKEYKNPIFYKDKIKSLIKEILPTFFTIIHGDITMSNIIYTKFSDKLFFIDPRGYFGKTLIYGDPNYDWAKLYYSIIGNYDKFNKKDFILAIDEKSIKFSILENKWEISKNCFFKLTGAKQENVELLHGLIWLSLTTYVWDDYDSICGAFYKGCIEMERFL